MTGIGSGRIYTNETDYHFDYVGGQMTGLAGTTRANWCRLPPVPARKHLMAKYPARLGLDR